MKDSDAMQRFPSLIQNVQNYIEEDPEDILDMYISSISYTLEYYGLHRLKEIYSEESKKYFEKGMRTIRENIRGQILDDLEWFDPEDNHESDKIQEILDHAEYIFKMFGMRMTTKFKNDMELTAFEGLPRKAYSPWQYDKGFEKAQDLKFKQELIDREKEEKEIENLFNQVSTEKRIDGLIDFKKKKKESNKDYFKRVLDLNVNDLKILSQLEALAFQAIKNTKETFSNGYLKKYFSDIENDDKLTSLIESINPIIIESNNRFSFGNDKLRNYLGLSYLVKMPNEKRIKFLENDYEEIFFENPGLHEEYWKIWNEINPRVFTNDFVKIYWNKFKSSLDFTNKTNLFKSIMKYSEQEISVSIDNNMKEMECIGGSIGGGILWHIFEHYSQHDIFDVPSWYFDTFRYQDDKMNDSFFILNKEHHEELKNYVLNNFDSREYFLDKSINEYVIPLSQEVDNPQVLKLFSELGMIESMSSLMEQLNIFFNKLTS